MMANSTMESTIRADANPRGVTNAPVGNHAVGKVGPSMPRRPVRKVWQVWYSLTRLARGEGGYPEIPGDVAAADTEAEGDGAGNLQPQGIFEEAGNARQETAIDQNAQNDEIHPVIEATPDRRAEHATDARNDQRQPQYGGGVIAQAMGAVGQPFDPQRNGRQIGKANEHPGGRAIPEQGVLPQMAQTGQGIGPGPMQAESGLAPSCPRYPQRPLLPSGWMMSRQPVSSGITSKPRVNSRLVTNPLKLITRAMRPKR